MTENAGELTGYDTVVIASNFAGGTYRVADYANIEALKALDGAGKIDLIGSDIANKLTGNAFDNVLEGRGGNDEIDGGGGVNAAVFTGAKADYTITKNAGGTYTVADTVQDRDGTDLLKNIRFLQFSDGILDLEQAVPTLSISSTDAAKSEGNEGITEYVFTVTRDTTSGRSTVDWTLSGLGGLGAAVLGDFDGPTSGTLTFEGGEREKTIVVKVKGDKDVEGHETFNVSLSNAANATMTTDTAKGVIINDDAVPVLSIAATDAAKLEGDTGYTAFTFTISRSSGDGTSSVRWTIAGTGDNPASLGEFEVLTDVVSFAKDETTKTIRIRVKADREVEGDETFSVVLSDPTDATIGVGVGSATGTIIEDDILNIAPTNIRLATGEAAASASESMDAGQVVARVMADDDGSDSDLRYYIADNPYFVIDERSGDIKIKSGTRLNYEDGADGTHTVVVTVRDLKGTGLAATQSIVINIDDVNEAATGINFIGAQVVKANATLKGANVVLATADDPDTKQEYKDNLYRFAKGSTTDGIFTIDVETGQITANRAVTSEDVGDYVLRVVAYDEHNPDLTRTVSYRVTVVAADNQDPTITGVVASGKGEAGTGADMGTFVIYENEGAGVVADVNASDNDLGQALTYSLAGANGTYNGLFSIAADGKISITDPAALNLNADKDYVLTVQVSDGNGGIDTETVTIRVKNVVPANAAPSTLLLNGSMETAINEFDALNGASLGFVSASDPGDSLRYSLIDNGGGLFAINESTGQLVVVGGLNYEQAASHQITVRATDSANQFVDSVFTIRVNDQTNWNKRGKSKNDKMNGSALDDILKGGTKSGKDTIKGLDGDDKLYGEGGNDKVYGGNGIDFVRGDAGNDTVKGDAGNDKVYGGSGNDKVYGGSGDDRVYGGAGNDTVKGDSGNDIIYGGAGNDKLYGGSGKDVFVFNTKASKTKNLDKIMDFKVVDDTIWLENKVFTKLGKAGSEAAPAALNKNFFRVGTKAKDKNDYIVYDKKKGILYYDADGSGKKAAVEIATVKKGLKLTADDFFII